MSNQFITPGEAARLICNDIHAYLEELPPEERADAAYAVCNALSLSVGGPGVARPKKKKKKNERKQNHSGVRKGQKGVRNGEGRHFWDTVEPVGAINRKPNW
jgi:hypothetical protein